MGVNLRRHKTSVGADVSARPRQIRADISAVGTIHRPLQTIYALNPRREDGPPWADRINSSYASRNLG
jgi:hypothetical protein